MDNYIYLIVFLPLLGFIFSGVFGSKLPKLFVGIISNLVIWVPFLISLYLFINFKTPVKSILFNWFELDNVKVNFSFAVDQLSLVMMLIVTGIGGLIHIYSIGYMKEDSGFYKFFAYLNLFIFFMLLLVMGSNFLVLFIGWEGVGFCSYLLIGFWFKNKEYCYAARKAFIMNRIGDLGLLIGVFIIATIFGSIEFSDLSKQLSNLGFVVNDPILILITIFLFIGAMGKSAQIPLYTWLPDAMAGPTPVSALIHAATMVTAGIYMIIRCNALYSFTPFTLDFIMYIGLATSLLASFIGLRQNDIKKVLAYSTVSQLGFMFIAIGASAYTTALFHVATHAFFKALLFLGAGSVIHSMGGEQDMRFMGGLNKKIPLTYYTFLIGTLAICGIPPLAGMFSKDEILNTIYLKSPIVWGLTLFSAALTCLYMFRLLFLTFFGNFRGTQSQEKHLHESPFVMTVPLLILSILTIFGGVINLPNYFQEYFNIYFTQELNKWITPLYFYLPNHKHLDISMEFMLFGITLLVIISAFVITYIRYAKKGIVPVSELEIKGWSKYSYNAAYVNQIYDYLIVNPLLFIAKFIKNIFDKYIVDGLVRLVYCTIDFCGNILKFVQNGRAEFYLLAISMGILAMLFSVTFLVK